jgi:hypothetical protein
MLCLYPMYLCSQYSIATYLICTNGTGPASSAGNCALPLAMLLCWMPAKQHDPSYWSGIGSHKAPDVE